MRTAEEIQEEYAIETGYETFQLLIEADLDALDWHVSKVQWIYGRQCAEQALKDAAENVSIRLDYEDYRIADWIDKESILSTPIQTP
jgi:hypothetical protein